MKKMYKYFSLAIAAIMTLCICSFGMVLNVGAAAANQIVITNSNSAVSISGNTYTAYKVFAATVGGSEDTSAHNYTLDAGCLNGTTGYTGLNASYTPTGINNTNVRAFADALYNAYIKGQTVPNTVDQVSGAVADGQETITLTVPASGYYIVVGEAKSKDGQDTVVTSLAMLDTSSDKKGAEISLKADVPTITNDGKKAKDANESDYKNVNDSQIGEEIEYKINVTVPHVNGYSNYVYKIKDQLSEGLQYVDNSVVLKNGTTAITEGTNAGQYWSKIINNTARTMEVSVDILKGLLATTKPFNEGDTLTLTYKAKVVGTDAKYATKNNDDPNFNSNTVKLEYSNNPYNSTSTDETPTFKSYNYTYGVEVDKITSDATPAAVPGAVFNIYEGATTGTPLQFIKVSADGAETPVYKLYQTGDTGTAVSDLTSGTVNGKFIAYGFDSDTLYNLKEKTAPSGYSVIDNDIPFKITAQLAATGGDSADMITSLIFNNENKNSADGIQYINASDENGLTIKVPNTAGSKLVGTGGMGTTIFYVAGGILMAGAAILLITKLRMRNKD